MHPPGGISHISSEMELVNDDGYDVRNGSRQELLPTAITPTSSVTRCCNKKSSPNIPKITKNFYIKCDISKIDQ